MHENRPKEVDLFTWISQKTAKPVQGKQQNEHLKYSQKVSFFPGKITLLARLQSELHSNFASWIISRISSVWTSLWIRSSWIINQSPQSELHCAFFSLWIINQIHKYELQYALLPYGSSNGLTSMKFPVNFSHWESQHVWTYIFL